MPNPIALTEEQIAELRALDVDFNALDVEYRRLERTGQDVSALRAKLTETRQRRDLLLNEYGPAGVAKAKRDMGHFTP